MGYQAGHWYIIHTMSGITNEIQFATAFYRYTMLVLHTETGLRDKYMMNAPLRAGEQVTNPSSYVQRRNPCATRNRQYRCEKEE